MASAVSASSSLTELNLSYNGIDDIGADNLAKGMTESARLTILDLTGNRIEAGGAQLLLQALEITPRMTGLSLHGNPSLGRAIQKQVQKVLSSRRSEEYRLNSHKIAPIRQPALFPIE